MCIRDRGGWAQGENVTLGGAEAWCGAGRAPGEDGHGHLVDDVLLVTLLSQRVSGPGAGEELQQDLRKELLRRERKCESGSGVLLARSAVPAGTRARLLLTYIRLVEGGRLQRDRRERVQRDAGSSRGGG